MPRMIPIRFGGSGPDRANGRNRDHHGAGGEDHAAGVDQAGDYRLARVVAAATGTTATVVATLRSPRRWLPPPLWAPGTAMAYHPVAYGGCWTRSFGEPPPSGSRTMCRP
jgi:hypothetical protein